MTTLKRTLFIQVDDDGLREIYEPDDQMMLELGWCRVDLAVAAARQTAASVDLFLNAAAIPEPNPALAHLRPAIEAVNGNGTNGHPIPDLAPLPREPAESGIPRAVLIGETEHGDSVYATSVPCEVKIASREGKLPSAEIEETAKALAGLLDCNPEKMIVHARRWDALLKVLDERLGKG